MNLVGKYLSKIKQNQNKDRENNIKHYYNFSDILFKKINEFNIEEKEELIKSLNSQERGLLYGISTSGVARAFSSVKNGVNSLINGVKRVAAVPFHALSGDLFQSRNIATNFDKDQKIFSITTTGIMTPGASSDDNRNLEFQRDMKKTPYFSDIKNPTYVYNPTGTIVADFLAQIVPDTFGLPSLPTLRMKDTIMQAYNTAISTGHKTEDIRINITGHSQGTATAIEAFKLLPKEVRKTIDYIGMGSQTDAYEGLGLGSYINIHNVNDIVPKAPNQPGKIIPFIKNNFNNTIKFTNADVGLKPNPITGETPANGPVSSHSLKYIDENGNKVRGPYLRYLDQNMDMIKINQGHQRHEN